MTLRLLLPLFLARALCAAPTEVIAPTENLVVQGLPPIPASLAEEVRRYTESRSASLASWHPERREMLIATRFGDTSQIHHVASPGGARTQLTFASEPIAHAEFEPKAGRYFVFAKDTGGNEFAQLYRSDLADGRTTLLTDGGRSQNGGWRWSRARDRIAYTSTRRNGADRDLWLIDPTQPKSDRLLAELPGGGWGVSDWSPDDTQLVVTEYLSASRSRLWLMKVRTGEKTLLTPPEAEVTYGRARFTADGRGLFVTSDEENEFERLCHLDLASKKLTPLTTGIPWDIEAFDLSRDGARLAFIVNEAGVSKLHLMNTATRQHTPARHVPPGVIGGLEWHANGRDLGFSLNSARSSSDAWSLDAETGDVTRWTASELGGLVAAELSLPELVEWPSFDGRKISGFLTRPPARFSGPRPVIINIHGGPEGQAQPDFLGRSNYFLNELGIALITPNVRGSTGYGKSFQKLDNGLLREDSVRDIGALLDWIATQPDLDAGRVMISGGSYGGYMTLAVAVHYSDRIRCAMDVVGISHFGTFLKNTESYRRALRRVEYGDETDPAMAAFFDKIAPLNQAAKITKPLFVVQGGNDPRVPLSEAEQIVARVRENGTPVWYLMAKDEGHGFGKKRNRDFHFYATVMFVRTHLLGGER